MLNNKKAGKHGLPYAKFTNLLSIKLDFQKMDQHTGGKWLIHGTKRRRDT